MDGFGRAALLRDQSYYCELDRRYALSQGSALSQDWDRIITSISRFAAVSGCHRCAGSGRRRALLPAYDAIDNV